MVRRSRKKSRTGRGSRTYGHGAGKKHRGKAHRGGNPNQGWNKRHWIRTLITNPGRIGKHGFTSVWKEKTCSINVGQLDEAAELLLTKQLATKEGNKIIIDIARLKVDKVLGSGRVTRPLVLLASNVSASAKQKVESAGGEIRNV